MTLVMGWIGRSRKLSAQPAADGVRLVYPMSMLILGVVCGGGFFAAAVAVLFSHEHGKAVLSFFFLAFSMLGWPLVLGYFVEFHEVTSTGMSSRSMFLRRIQFPWSSIKSVSYNAAMKWFVVETDNNVLRVSAYLSGLPEFAKAVRTHAPNKTQGEHARRLLEETAAGRPPSPWM